MPLRVTLELIPKGDESKKIVIGTLDIENDGTGDMGNFQGIGNYDCRLRGPVQNEGNNQFWQDVRLEGFERKRGYWSCVKEALNKSTTDYDI